MKYGNLKTFCNEYDGFEGAQISRSLLMVKSKVYCWGGNGCWSTVTRHELQLRESALPSRVVGARTVQLDAYTAYSY